MIKNLKIENNSIKIKRYDGFYKILVTPEIRKALIDAFTSHSKKRIYEHNDVFMKTFKTTSILIYKGVDENNVESTRVVKNNSSKLNIINNSDGVTIIIDMNEEKTKINKVDIGIITISRRDIVKNNLQYLLTLG